MTRPDILPSLVRASAALSDAHDAAKAAGRPDLAAAIREEAVRIMTLVGMVTTRRAQEVANG